MISSIVSMDTDYLVAIILASMLIGVVLDKGLNKLIASSYDESKREHLVRKAINKQPNNQTRRNK